MIVHCQFGTIAISNVNHIYTSNADLYSNDNTLKGVLALVLVWFF